MSYRSVILADNPVSYWRLDDTGLVAVDTVAGYSGALIGGYAQSVPGAIARDLDTATTFDGSTGYANVGSPSPLLSIFQNHDFSVEFWAKGSGSNFILSCGVFNNANTDTFLHVGFDGSGHAKLGFFGGDDLTGGTVISTSKWVHVVATFNSSTKLQTIYLNGVSDGSRTANGVMNVPAGSLVQLARAFFATGNGPYWFGGQVDEVAAYGYVLTAAQVLTHYNTGATQGSNTFGTPLGKLTPGIAPPERFGSGQKPQPVIGFLRYKILDPVTGATVIDLLPHPHRSKWDVRAPVPGGTGGSSAGNFDIPLFEPGNDEYKKAKVFYDQLVGGQRVEAYLSANGEGAAGAPAFSGIIRQTPTALNGFSIKGVDSIHLLQLARSNRTEFFLGTTDALASQATRAYQLLFGDDGSSGLGAYAVTTGWSQVASTDAPTLRLPCYKASTDPADLLLASQPTANYSDCIIDAIVEMNFNTTQQPGQFNDLNVTQIGVSAAGSDTSNYWLGYINVRAVTSAQYELDFRVSQIIAGVENRKVNIPVAVIEAAPTGRYQIQLQGKRGIFTAGTFKASPTGPDYLWKFLVNGYDPGCFYVAPGLGSTISGQLGLHFHIQGTSAGSPTVWASQITFRNRAAIFQQGIWNTGQKTISQQFTKSTNLDQLLIAETTEGFVHRKTPAAGLNKDVLDFGPVKGTESGYVSPGTKSPIVSVSSGGNRNTGNSRGLVMQGATGKVFTAGTTVFVALATSYTDQFDPPAQGTWVMDERKVSTGSNEQMEFWRGTNLGGVDANACLFNNQVANNGSIAITWREFSGLASGGPVSHANFTALSAGSSMSTGVAAVGASDLQIGAFNFSSGSDSVNTEHTGFSYTVDPEQRSSAGVPFSHSLFTWQVASHYATDENQVDVTVGPIFYAGVICTYAAAPLPVGATTQTPIGTDSLVRFEWKRNILGASIEPNNDTLATDISLQLSPNSTSSGYLEWHNIPAIKKYGLLVETVQAQHMADWGAGLNLAQAVSKTRSRTVVAKKFTVLRDPETAGKWRELDWIVVHVPEIGLNNARVQVMQYTFEEGSATQDIIGDTFPQDMGDTDTARMWQTIDALASGTTQLSPSSVGGIVYDARAGSPQVFTAYGGFQGMDAAVAGSDGQARLRFFLPTTVQMIQKITLSLSLVKFRTFSSFTASSTGTNAQAESGHSHGHTHGGHIHDINFGTVGGGSVVNAVGAGGAHGLTLDNAGGPAGSIDSNSTTPGSDSTGSSGHTHSHSHTVSGSSALGIGVDGAGGASVIKVFIDGTDRTAALPPPSILAYGDYGPIDITQYVYGGGWHEIAFQPTSGLGGIIPQVQAFVLVRPF